MDPVYLSKQVSSAMRGEKSTSCNNTSNMYSQQKHTFLASSHRCSFFSGEKNASQSPLSSWDGTAERNLGEVNPLKVPMMLNNFDFPPPVSQKLSMARGQACPERINPSCLKWNSTEDRREQTSPRSRVLCHANSPHSDLAKN